jgi:hypothetical protein
MARSEKKATLDDFKKLVSETKERYLKEKMEYNWDYTLKEETLDGMEFFMICNKINATKLIYNEEMSFIVNKDIIMADVRILSEMKEQLK